MTTRNIGEITRLRGQIDSYMQALGWSETDLHKNDVLMDDETVDNLSVDELLDVCYMLERYVYTLS